MRDRLVQSENVGFHEAKAYRTMQNKIESEPLSSVCNAFLPCGCNRDLTAQEIAEIRHKMRQTKSPTQSG